MLVIESSKTIESANKLVKDGRKLYDPVFKYWFVQLGCKHYGKSKTSTKSHGILRPNQSYLSLLLQVNFSATPPPTVADPEVLAIGRELLI